MAQEIEMMRKITDFIFLPADAKGVHLAFAFGTPHSNDIFARHIGNMFRLGYFSKILLTGGSVRSGLNESKLLAELLLRESIPKDNLLLEDHSSNSKENVLFGRELLIKKGIVTPELALDVLVFCKDYASRRCALTLHQYFPEANASFSPIEIIPELRSEWHLSETFRKKVFMEVEKIKEYFGIAIPG